MAKLETVPIWWYEAISLIMIAMSLGVILGYPTHLSWWAFFVSLVIAAVLVRTDRNNPGCHEYPNRAKCGHGVHHWMHAAGSSNGYNAV